MPAGFMVPAGASLTSVFNVSVPTSMWSGVTGAFTADVAVDGLLASDIPVVDIDAASAAETKQMLKQWSKVWSVDTYNGSIRLHAANRPTADLVLRLMVVR